MTQITETRETLKKDILKYLETAGVSDSDVLTKALDIIKSAAHNSYLIDEYDEDLKREFKKYLKEVGVEKGEFYINLSRSFSPRHYHAIVGFVQRYEKILDAEWDEEIALVDEIEDNLQSQREIFREDYEYGDVPGEVIIYSDRIEIRARGYRPEFKDSLPSGGKYQGKGTGTWVYPISIRDKFPTAIGKMYGDMPVLFADK